MPIRAIVSEDADLESQNDTIYTWFTFETLTETPTKKPHRNTNKETRNNLSRL